MRSVLLLLGNKTQQMKGYLTSFLLETEKQNYVTGVCNQNTDDFQVAMGCRDRRKFHGKILFSRKSRIPFRLSSFQILPWLIPHLRPFSATIRYIFLATGRRPPALENNLSVCQSVCQLMVPSPVLYTVALQATFGDMNSAIWAE